MPNYELPSTPNLAAIAEVADRMQALNPQPAPRYLLLRDVLCLPEGDAELAGARTTLEATPHVLALAQAQQPDGSWGRFHSQDTTVHQRYPTSEYAIERALALGLDHRHPVLVRARQYIEGHLRGEVAWRDRVEKHDDPRLWPFFTRFISAGRLAQLAPAHPLLAEFMTFMRALLTASFSGGAHEPLAERRAQQVLSGIPTRGHWPLLSNVYGVLQLGAVGPLPGALEGAWLEWLLGKPGGIYYVTGDHSSIADMPEIQAPAFSGWLRAHELLSRFPRWYEQAHEAAAWLWSQRNANGLWDVSPRASQWIYWPLSNNWRRKQDRIIDGSVRILALLRRWVDANTGAQTG